MVYQPPPGINSLPPRPPIGASNSNSNSNNGRSGFKPAFPSASKAPGQSYSSAPSYPASAPGYNSTASSTARYGPSAYSSYPGAPGANISTAGRGYGYQPTSQPNYGTQNYGQAPTTYPSGPQIRNPFPNPGQTASAGSVVVSNPIASANPFSVKDYDPDMAAQIAQWQSAYSRDPTAAAPALDKYGKPIPVEIPKPELQPIAIPNNPDKKKTVVRQGGGKKWTDDTLLEWDPAHLRLFVGNLAGETTDDSLLKAFAPWKSVQKAKVVRDRRTNKSKGYGFVSFSDADDFFNAAKTMNGQYIQSHPVIVKKANTEIKAVNVKDKKGGKNSKNNYKKSGNHSGGGHCGDAGSGFEPSLGPVAASGIVKPGQKTKNGLRLLG